MPRTQAHKSRWTLWRGVWFRSSLECCWAEALASAGLAWLYKPRRFYFAADGSTYLPDFELPQLGCWLEIKPEAPSIQEEYLARRLAEVERKPVYFGIGKPWLSPTVLCVEWFGLKTCCVCPVSREVIFGR